MTDLTNEVREALDNLLISAGVRPFTRMAAKQYGTNEVCALIAAIEAAQLQYLGNLSDAEIVEAAFPFNTEDDTPTWSAAYEPAKLVHKHFCERVCAALPILQAPLRAEIERLKALLATERFRADNLCTLEIEQLSHTLTSVRELRDRAESRAQSAERERDETMASNRSVAVCASHTTEVVGEGCLVCDCNVLVAEVKRLRERDGEIRTLIIAATQAQETWDKTIDNLCRAVTQEAQTTAKRGTPHV